jgi:hypothetical protein
MTTFQKAPSRPRRPNGHRRASRVYSVRDLNPHTEHRIDKLAEFLCLRRGQVLDQAILQFFEQTFPDDVATEPEPQSQQDMSWIMRPQDRLSAEECPEVAALEHKLAETRRRRDAIMGRAG